MDLNFCKKIILKYIPLKVVDNFFYYQLLLIAPFIKLYTKYTGASLPKSTQLLKKVGVFLLSNINKCIFRVGEYHAAHGKQKRNDYPYRL